MKKLFLNDHFILILIFLNAIVLFWAGFELDSATLLKLRWADSIVTGLFLIEMGVKLNEYGVKTYFSSGWNRFDFLLVLLSVPALVAFVFGVETIGLSYLITFRILRVFKSFRFFKFVPNMAHIIKGVQLALKASVFVLLAFVVFVFIVSLLSHYIFANSPTDYFENPAKSLYTIFKVFTVEGWAEIPEQLTQNYTQLQSFFTYFYFALIVLFGGVLGLSLVTSIFVDSMVSDNNDELEEKMDRMEAKLDRVLERNNNAEN